jgi:hypothetical protein
MDSLYIGIDWSKAKHDVCILNSEGAILKEFTIAQTSQGHNRLEREIESFKVISVNLSEQPVQFDRFGNFSGNSHCRYYVHEPLENSIHLL